MQDQSRTKQGNRGLTAPAVGILLVLLALPVSALVKISALVDSRVIAGYSGAISLITLLLYRSDKKQAERGEWRTPEGTLHWAELFGGWPVAFLAQRILRHKISKRSYQISYYAIVFVHQYVAFEFLQSWRISMWLVGFLQP